jgi:hypothetical protein
MTMRISRPNQQLVLWVYILFIAAVAAAACKGVDDQGIDRYAYAGAH